MLKNDLSPKATDFKSLTLKLASPEKILAWSHGEVTKPETINYRTGRAERGGLFDERIFGPEKDYECYCGKYKRIRYKDIVCEKCGVEVTKSIVRRERMGHIALSSPVAHIWFLRGVPSRMGLLLDLSIGELEKVIYFAGYIITKVNEDEKAKLVKELEAEYKTKSKTLTDAVAGEKLKASLTEAKRQLDLIKPWAVLDELSYHRLSLKFGRAFEAGIGAEAIHKIFQTLNLDQLLESLQTELVGAGALARTWISKRYNLVKSMKQSGIRPEWMFLTLVPIIPPALRPMVALEGGRHATSDINDLYRRVINRNNRLKKLQELSAPEVILRNEKRILQEAVDALIHNSIRKHGGENAALNQAQRRPLKSLADNLIGKQGRFRQNLLGKRVDYSGRSVIVVGPELKLSQCGLPKHMALELFKPFIISKILERELAFHVRGANRLIEEAVPDVWAILEEVIKDKYVFLNRAPTLHRLGIQAFRPVLVEGNAIHLHPLVCVAFNADFDGDAMTVHVPLSEAAQKEAREMIAADKNLLKPGNGDPIISMRMDIVLGCYWVTKVVEGAKGEGHFFPNPNAAIMAYEFGQIDIRAKVKLLGGKPEKYGDLSGKLFETSVGRILFNYSLPSDRPFINREVVAKDITALIEEMIDHYGVERMPDILDKIKKFGFHWATVSGVTWGIDDVMVPAGKEAIVAAGRAAMEQVEKDYNDGWLSADEKYRKTIEIWQQSKGQIEKLLPASLPVGGSTSDMLLSKARGSWDNVSQMAGMKGLIINPANRLIEFPIIQSYKEGLSPLEYFVTTHGSRKTLADTALNTAKAGYLTRKLVDVAQEVVVITDDCGDKDGKLITIKSAVGFEKGIASLIRGRVLAKDLHDQGGTLLFKKGTLLGREEVARIDAAGLTEVLIRSPLSCRAIRGVCQKCYGSDLGRGGLVKIGEPVGVVAAQAIGEPGTQLTLRTKHSGGVGGADIVGGLPRVEEIFERRAPKHPALLTEVDGHVLEIKPLDHGEKMLVILPAAGSKRKKKAEEQIDYQVPAGRTILVKPGDEVKRGDFLTDGSADLVELFRLAGRQALEDYVIKETNAIYALHGGSIAPKHIEIIIRQMLSRRRVTKVGTTKLTEGEIVEEIELADENLIAVEKGGEEAEAEQIVLGITEAALNTSSFLAAVSFQHATKVLIDTAIRGGVDKLRGLKENVILGRLIPAGTGLKSPEEKKDTGSEIPTLVAEGSADDY